MLKTIYCDKLELKYRQWLSKAPRAVIVLVHGLGGYSGRFEEFGQYLRDLGLSVYAIELPGFGESPGIRGDIDNFKTYTRSLKYLLEHAKAEFAGLPVFMLGESMGGLITLDYTIHQPRDLSGIILLSPAVREKLSVSWADRLDIIVNLMVNPLKKFYYPFHAAMFTRDAKAAARINDDPLEIRNFTARFFFAILKAMFFVRLNAWRVRVPLLLLQADIDHLVDKAAVLGYFKKIASKDKTLKVYENHYHALYLDEGRDAVFGDIRNWLSRHC